MTNLRQACGGCETEFNQNVMQKKQCCFSVLNCPQQGEFKVSERYLTMDDLTAALEANRVKEMFGAGTACVVCPVSAILYQGEVR